MPKPLISIVTPVFNEEQNVRACHAAIADLRRRLIDDYVFEHIFTDNHSTDRTFALLAEIARGDAAVRVFRFSRNFGYQRSIYEGFMHAKGEAVVQFDGDLQDPPAMIETFLREWRAGAKVVYGVRVRRQEGFFDGLLRKLFYRILNRLSQSEIPEGAGDFRLVDRQLVEELRRVRDNKIYLRGRIAEMGFVQKGIDYERAARTAGKSKFNFSRNLALAIDALLTHTAVPLRLSIYFGLFIFCLSFFGGVAYMVAYFTSSVSWPPGFMTLLILLLAHLGLTSLFLGILGEYIARMYEHMKVPQGVIYEESING